MFRLTACRGVVDLSNVHEAAEMFLTCQRVARWSKAVPTRGSRESFTLVTLEREALFRSLTEQAKAAEYHGNVRVLNKLTREPAGQLRIKPIPSVPFNNNNTMTMGAAQTNERQYFEKLLQGRVTTLADFRTRSTRCLLLDHACRTSVFLSKRYTQPSCARQAAKVQVLMTFQLSSSKLAETRWSPFCVPFFHGILEQGCMPLSLVSRYSDVPTLERQIGPSPLLEPSWHPRQQRDSFDFL